MAQIDLIGRHQSRELGEGTTVRSKLLLHHLERLEGIVSLRDIEDVHDQADPLDVSEKVETKTRTSRGPSEEPRGAWATPASPRPPPPPRATKTCCRSSVRSPRSRPVFWSVITVPRGTRMMTSAPSRPRFFFPCPWPPCGARYSCWYFGSRRVPTDRGGSIYMLPPRPPPPPPGPPRGPYFSPPH